MLESLRSGRVASCVVAFLFRSRTMSDRANSARGKAARIAFDDDRENGAALSPTTSVRLGGMDAVTLSDPAGVKPHDDAADLVVAPTKRNGVCSSVVADASRASSKSTATSGQPAGTKFPRRCVCPKCRAPKVGARRGVRRI